MTDMLLSPVNMHCTDVNETYDAKTETLKICLDTKTFETEETTILICCNDQGGHSSGKPGKVRELKSGQGKVRENRRNQGKVRENELLQLFSCRDYCSDSNW